MIYSETIGWKKKLCGRAEDIIGTLKGPRGPKNIAQMMHINDIFAMNSKIRRKKTVLRWNKFVFK